MRNIKFAIIFLVGLSVIAVCTEATCGQDRVVKTRFVIRCGGYKNLIRSVRITDGKLHGYVSRNLPRFVFRNRDAEFFAYREKCRDREARIIVRKFGLSGVYDPFAAKHAHGRQPQKPESKPDSQAEFKAAQRRVAEAETARNSAQMTLDAAVADRNALLFKMMAEQSVKPSQCAIESNQFACVKIDPKTGDVSFVAKPSPSP